MSSTTVGASLTTLAKRACRERGLLRRRRGSSPPRSRAEGQQRPRADPPPLQRRGRQKANRRWQRRRRHPDPQAGVLSRLGRSRRGRRRRSSSCRHGRSRHGRSSSSSSNGQRQHAERSLPSSRPPHASASHRERLLTARCSLPQSAVLLRLPRQRAVLPCRHRLRRHRQPQSHSSCPARAASCSTSLRWWEQSHRSSLRPLLRPPLPLCLLPRPPLWPR